MLFKEKKRKGNILLASQGADEIRDRDPDLVLKFLQEPCAVFAECACEHESSKTLGLLDCAELRDMIAQRSAVV